MFYQTNLKQYLNAKSEQQLVINQSSIHILLMSKQSKKYLTPTKNPFPSTVALSNLSNTCSFLAANNPGVRTSFSSSKQKPRRLVQTMMRSSYGLKKLSQNQNVLKNEAMTKSSNKFSLINTKIESILNSYDKIKQKQALQKLATKNDRDRLKRSKQNRQQKLASSKQDKENLCQGSLKQKNNRLATTKVHIPKLSLKDISITNINYPIQPKKQKPDKGGRKDSGQFTVASPILIPKAPKLSIKNEAQIQKKQSSSQKQEKSDPIIEKLANVSVDLEQLQNSEQHIDSLLTTLQKDFLPRNTDYFVYNQEQIKLPKIFRKSKTNNQMYKSCTGVQNQIQQSSIEGFKSVLVEKSTMRKGSNSQSLSLIQRQLNNFLMGLKTQICLDAEFKKVKQWFLYNKSQDKWKKLQHQLKLSNLWINQLTMKVIFLYQNEQANPFQSVVKQQYSIKELIISFRTAEQHWNEYVLHKFDQKLLKGAGFTENVLDSSKKGYISIEDLIRFLHCKLKEFYYTRDLSMIYLRLKGGEKLQYQQMMAKISNNLQ